MNDSLDEPATKATDVPDRPPAKTDNPPAKTGTVFITAFLIYLTLDIDKNLVVANSSVGDKGPTKSCEAKARVRRADPVIENRYIYDSPQFTLLRTTSPMKSNDDWHEDKDGKGYALSQSVSKRSLFAAWCFERVFVLGYLLRLSECSECLHANADKQYQGYLMGYMGSHGLYIPGYVSIKMTETKETNECGMCIFFTNPPACRFHSEL